MPQLQRWRLPEEMCRCRTELRQVRIRQKVLPVLWNLRHLLDSTLGRQPFGHSYQFGGI